MLGDGLWKKQKPAKKGKKYPTYVGDLPVKVIQDIIDSLGLTGDWEKIAGRTGISERQVRLLKSKHNDQTEIARIVFEQWLCRIPKPKDLAFLLLCVDRFGDIRKLQPYIDPKEWPDVEKRMQRAGAGPGPGASAPPLSRLSSRDSQATESDVAPPAPAPLDAGRVTSEEESSAMLPALAPRPPASLTSSIGPSASSVGSVRRGRPDLTSRAVTEGSQPPRGALSEISDDVLSTSAPVPVKRESAAPVRRQVSAAPFPPAPCREPSPPEGWVESTEMYLNFLCEFEWDMSWGMEQLPGHPYLHSFHFLSQNWVAKSFKKKGPIKLIRELSFLVRFRHPHIVPLSGFIRCPDPSTGQCTGDVDDYLLVYPYLPNGTLQDFLASSSRRDDLSLRLSLMRQVGEALAYIHGRGFVHGDLSLANVLLDRNMGAVLVDFELAMEADQPGGSKQEVVECTPPFAPIGDDGYTVERDIFAFGIILALVYVRQEWRPRQGGQGELHGAELVAELFDRALPVPSAGHIHARLRQLCISCVRPGHKDSLEMISVVKQLVDMTTIRPDSQRFWENPADVGEQRPSVAKCTIDD